MCSTRGLKTTDLPRLSGRNPDVNGHFGVEGRRAAWKGGSRSGGASTGGHVFGGEKDEVMYEVQECTERSGGRTSSPSQIHIWKFVMVPSLCA